MSITIKDIKTLLPNLHIRVDDLETIIDDYSLIGWWWDVTFQLFANGKCVAEYTGYLLDVISDIKRRIRNVKQA